MLNHIKNYNNKTMDLVISIITKASVLSSDDTLVVIDNHQHVLNVYFPKSRSWLHAGTPNKICYTFSKENFYGIYTSLRDYWWNECINVNLTVSGFHRIIYSVLDKCAQKGQLNNSKYFQSIEVWFSKGITDNNKLKDQFRKKKLYESANQLTLII